MHAKFYRPSVFFLLSKIFSWKIFFNNDNEVDCDVRDDEKILIKKK